jgi:hypothetical protein
MDHCERCGELFDVCELFMGLCSECYDELWFGEVNVLTKMIPKRKFDDEEV